jgi:hypothetical protein
MMFFWVLMQCRLAGSVSEEHNVSVFTVEDGNADVDLPVYTASKPRRRTVFIIVRNCK